MDIDKILHTKVEVNNDREKLTAYNLSRGPSYSLNENLVPEQLFDNPDTPEKEADGISATKALSLAAQQGQTIYTITKANYAEVLPKLNHSDVVITDIRNGINAGKTVTVHDTQITLNGWSGTGYTILDPESGAGAYMIGGGLDGGFTSPGNIAILLNEIGLISNDVLNNSIKRDGLYNNSSRTTWLQNLRSFAYFMGAAIFAFSTYSTVTDSTLSLRSKIGRILVSLVSGYAVATVTAAVVGFGIFGIIFAAVFMLLISTLAYFVNSLEFNVRAVLRTSRMESYDV